MKKSIFLITAILFLAVVTPVRAQEQEASEPGITPNSPFYFFDSWGENLSMLFAFSPEAKTQKAAEIAGEKAAEARVMANAGDTEAAEQAVERYGAMISEAAENLALTAQSGEGFNAALAELVTKSTSIHLDVLTDVYEKVPTQAKPTIERALEQSEKGATQAAEALDNKPNSNEIREEVQQKIDEVRQRRGAPENSLPDGVIPNSGNGEKGNMQQQNTPEGNPQQNMQNPSNERGGPPENIPGERP